MTTSSPILPPYNLADPNIRNGELPRLAFARNQGVHHAELWGAEASYEFSGDGQADAIDECGFSCGYN
jgi:hypothetical protein